MMIVFTMVIGMVIAMRRTMQAVHICVRESRCRCKDSLARGARAAYFINQSRARDRWRTVRRANPYQAQGGADLANSYVIIFGYYW